MANEKNMNPVFSIKNFRSFGEEGADFELAPITVLTGCNSAGKSSLVKALMLLARQSDKFPTETSAKFFFEDTKTPVGKDGLLEVGLPEFKLGRFKNVLHNKSKDTIEMSYIVFSQYLQEYVKVKRLFRAREEDSVGNGECISYAIEKIDGTFTYYSSDSDDSSHVEDLLSKKLQSFEKSFKQHQKKCKKTDYGEKGSFAEIINDFPLMKEENDFSLMPKDAEERFKAWDILEKIVIDRELAQKKDKILVGIVDKVRQLKIKDLEKYPELDLEKFKKSGINISQKTTLGELLDKATEDNPEDRKVLEFIKEFASGIIGVVVNDFCSPLSVFKLLVHAEIVYPDFLRDTIYVKSDSVNVKRSYSIYGDDKMNAALHGKYEKLLWHPWDDWEESFTDRWVKKNEIGDRIEMVGDDDDSTIKLYLVRGDERRLLADEGYGITQLVSLLFSIENHIPSVPDGPSGGYLPKYICVEEPEVHLHPKYQSLLAEMFVEAYKKYNIRFIIETHSEYMIRKLQVMVADKENELKPSEVSINYVDKGDDGAATNRKIEILEDGRLSEEFGSGFFDESRKLVLKMMKF
ncbi:MAG: DUF3696 domain-containing protein [Bacteroidales bacterium]|nr:DUF3696 domain-containing protein [Bacteroidales bacterium]